MTGGAVTFLDMPLRTGQVTVRVAGSGAVSVGTLLIGRLAALGVTEAAPTAGITDFSKKEVDDFGDGASAFTLIAQGASEVAQNRVMKTGFEPSWDASGRSLENWRGAAAATFRGINPDGDAMAGLNSDPASDAGFQSLDFVWWLRGGGIGGNQCEAVINGVGTGFLGGAWDTNTVFQVTYDGRLVRWMKDGTQVYAVDAAAEMSFGFDSSILTHGAGFASIGFVPGGPAGSPGQAAPLLRTQWSINGVDGWHDNFFGADRYARFSNDNGATYGPAVLVVGESGEGAVQVFRRSATVPAMPGASTGNPPPGWSDGPPAGTDFLWMSKATYRAGVQQGGWSAPQRISGEPGVDGFAFDADPFYFPVPSFSNGTVKPAWAGGGGKMQLRKAGQPVTSGVTYDVVPGSVKNVAGVAVNGADFSFSAPTAESGSFVFRATYQGQTLTRTVTVEKVKDGNPAFQGSSQVDNAGAGSGSTATPGNKTARVTANVNYQVSNGQGTYVARIRVYQRNVSDNGAEVFLGEKVGSQSARLNQGTSAEPDWIETPGEASASFEFATATSDKIYAYRVETVTESSSSGLTIARGGSIRLETL